MDKRVSMVAALALVTCVLSTACDVDANVTVGKEPPARATAEPTTVAWAGDFWHELRPDAVEWMVLPPVPLGKTDYVPRGDLGYMDVSLFAAMSLVPWDTPQDLERAGWVGRFQANFTPWDVDAEDPALTEIGTAVDAFQSPEQAAAYTALEYDDVFVLRGTDVANGVIMVAAEPVDTSLAGAPHPYGVRYTFESPDGQRWTRWQIRFAHRDVAAIAWIDRGDDVDITHDINTIASQLYERVVDVFAGRLPGPEDIETPKFLGIRCSAPSKFIREHFALAPGDGCVVLRVSSPNAHEAGIRPGDRIVEMNGAPITSGRQFTRRFENRDRSDEPIRFVIERDGLLIPIDVHMDERTVAPESDEFGDYLAAKSAMYDWQSAVAYYNRAVRREPEFDLAYLYRAMAYDLATPLDGHAEAVERRDADLARALELDPEFPETHHTIAGVHAGIQMRFDDALAAIDEAIRLDGCVAPLEYWDVDCAEHFLLRATILLKRSRPEDFDIAELLIRATDAVEFMDNERNRAYSDLEVVRWYASEDDD